MLDQLLFRRTGIKLAEGLADSQVSQMLRLLEKMTFQISSEQGCLPVRVRN
jgi:hypothetical protein